MADFTIRISVDPNGTVTGRGNPNNLDTALFLAASNAVRQWKFGPYLHDGKPDNFDADITFHSH